VVLAEAPHHVTERGVDLQAVFSSDAEIVAPTVRQSNRLPGI